ELGMTTTGTKGRSSRSRRTSARLKDNAPSRNGLITQNQYSEMMRVLYRVNRNTTEIAERLRFVFPTNGEAREQVFTEVDAILTDANRGDNMGLGKESPIPPSRRPQIDFDLNGMQNVAATGSHVDDSGVKGLDGILIIMQIEENRQVSIGTEGFEGSYEVF